MFRDDDLDSCYDVQPNATCTDCGVDYSRSEDDRTTTCDPCSDRRDAHTSALQRRLVMAKAQTARVPGLVLTPRELSLCVVLLGRGKTVAQAIAHVQVRRSRLPFTPPEAA